MRGDTAGILSGIDANYGAGPDLQLHAAIPYAFNSPSNGAAAFGVGDGEIGAKIRILHKDQNRFALQAAIYPAVDFPTGSAVRNFGTGRTHAFLPLWLQKEFGKFVVYGGGGYWINPGAGNRNYWYSGATVERRIADDLTIGCGIFHQTANTMGGKDQTGFNVGAIYDLNTHYHLMLAVGQGLQNRSTTNEFSYYAALQITF